MSGHGPSTRPEVPEGKSRFLTTTQKTIVEGAFHVGYTTTWDSFQKEVKYTTPKAPQFVLVARPIGRAII